MNRLNTAQRQANFGGIGLSTNVSVAARPVTQQGMAGMKNRVGTAGLGRQVQDASYYCGILRAKMKEINGEISKLKGEIQQHTRDANSYAKYERKYEELIKEVRNLEGQLADYNLAQDKHRTDTPPEDIANFQQMLERQNKQEQQAVDQIFLERQHRGKAIMEVTEQIRELHQASEDKILSLPRQLQEEYTALTNQNQAKQQEINVKRDELDQMDSQIAGMEGALRKDRTRDEYSRLMKDLRKLTKEKSHVEVEAKAATMDPAEARKAMLAKVKEDTAKMNALKEKTARQREANEGAQKQISGLVSDINERLKEAGDSQKYEVLFQRDKEMSDFIDGFHAKKKQQLAEQAKMEERVVVILEHISRNMDREHNLPSRAQAGDRLKDMKEDLAFKSGNLAASKSTQARLEQELKKRTGELEKINTLDEKISVELQSLSSKMATMKEELVTFKDMDKLRDDAEAARVKLVALKKAYAKRKDAIHQQVKPLNRRYEKLKEALVEDETAKDLEGLEQKLRGYEQNIFHMQEFIAQQERETDFQTEKGHCGRLIDELNGMLISVAQRSGSSHRASSGYGMSM